MNLYLYHIIIGSLLVFRTLSIGVYTQIIVGNGKCLTVFDSDREINGGKLAVWTCDSTNPNQKFWYDQSTKQITAFGGKCIDNNNEVTLYSCQYGLNRRWDYDTATKQFKPERDNSLCLDAHGNEWHNDGGKIILYKCHSEPNQQWSMPSGCNNFESTIMLRDGVFVCRGTFTDGLNSDSAKNLCHNDYSICTMDSLDFYGLTNDECADTKIFEDCSFYASKVSSNGFGKCEREGGTNDVWGCGNLPWNKLVCNNQLEYYISHNGIDQCNNIYQFKSNHENELNEIDGIHETKSGVMCCKDVNPKQELLELYKKFNPISEYGKNQKTIAMNIISFESNTFDYASLNEFKNTLNTITESNTKSTSVKMFEKMINIGSLALSSIRGPRNNGLGGPLLSLVGSLVGLGLDQGKTIEQTLQASLEALAAFIEEQFDDANYKSKIETIDDELDKLKFEIRNYWSSQTALTFTRAKASIDNSGCVLESTFNHFENDAEQIIDSLNFFPITLDFIKERIKKEEYKYASTSVNIFSHYARLSVTKLEVLSSILSEWNLQYKCNQTIGIEGTYIIISSKIEDQINFIYNDMKSVFELMLDWDNNPLQPFYVKFRNIMSENDEYGHLLKAWTNIHTIENNALKKILNISPDKRPNSLLNYINNDIVGSWSNWIKCPNDGTHIKRITFNKRHVEDSSFCFTTFSNIYYDIGFGVYGIQLLCSDDNELNIGETYPFALRFLGNKDKTYGFSRINQCIYQDQILGVNAGLIDYNKNNYEEVADLCAVEGFCDSPGTNHWYTSEMARLCPFSSLMENSFICPDNQYICGLNVKISGDFIRVMVFDCC